MKSNRSRPTKLDVSPARLLLFLENPRSYPESVRRVRVLQTPSSFVALTERHVYKVKKPVNFGFLDFSTLEKRHYFCAREIALNRRLGPGVHLGIVPITLQDGRLAFGGTGKVVEYAVKMRRLSASHFLLRRIEQGEANPADVRAIVAKLAPFYEAQKPTPEIAAWGRIAKLRLSTNENFAQVEAFVGQTIGGPVLEAIRHYTDTFYRAHGELFAQRVRAHRIRDCHGDLHLEHIHLGPAGVIIYDCIEFNDRFRQIDVANDVAFLAMDLDFHGRPDLAQQVAEQMAKKLRDPDLLRVLDFYKCYRAFVRGKVESFREHSRDVSADEKHASHGHAAQYFRLALQYAIGGSTPLLLIVMGRVGSGKSTLAAALGQALGVEVFSSDRVRKELAGLPLHARGGAGQRRRLYAKAMSDRTYKAMTRSAMECLRQKHGAILDATFNSRRRRDDLRRVVDHAGVPYCFVEARASVATRKQRLGAREHAAGEISDARLEDFAALERIFTPPIELSSRCLLHVSTNRSVEDATTGALRALARLRAELGGKIG